MQRDTETNKRMKTDGSRPIPRGSMWNFAGVRAAAGDRVPTETVYGRGRLGRAAVAHLRAKGWPATNPVIVHAADSDAVLNVGRTGGDRNCRAFLGRPASPGRLNGPRSPHRDGRRPHGRGAVPEPSRAQALIRKRACRVQRLAPPQRRTLPRAEHAARGLDGRIDMLLDGGIAPRRNRIHREHAAKRRLLRHGLITVAMLEKAVGGSK